MRVAVSANIILAFLATVGPALADFNNTLPDDDARDAAIEQHNYLRRQVAIGNTTNYWNETLPKAGNMREVVRFLYSHV